MALFLDTETTGLSPDNGDSLVEVAIVDARGHPLLNTLVNPGRSIPWRATEVHGITSEMVRGQPTLTQLMPRIRQIVANETVVIYNSTFDTPFFPGQLQEARSIECAMRRFSGAIGAKRWQKLDTAAKHVGHRWTGTAHRALADALACRSVWEWLQPSDLARTTSPSPEDSTRLNPSSTSVLRCPKCTSLLRVPSGKLLDITCPSCRRTFRHQT
jgi:DNA polymerase III epsilon subunit-like protein